MREIGHIKMNALLLGSDGALGCNEIIFKYNIGKAKTEFLKLVPSHKQYCNIHIEKLLWKNWETLVRQLSQPEVAGDSRGQPMMSHCLVGDTMMCQ